MPAEFTRYIFDLASFIASATLITAYQLFICGKVKKDPTYTVQAINIFARTAWVETIMHERRDILAVQTPRNSTMAATFLASTSVLMIIGILTLSEGGKLESTWHVLNIVGATPPELWLAKLICLLLDMFVATIGFLIVLYRIDRAPKIMSMDYSDAG